MPRARQDVVDQIFEYVESAATPAVEIVLKLALRRLRDRIRRELVPPAPVVAPGTATVRKRRARKPKAAGPGLVPPTSTTDVVPAVEKPKRKRRTKAEMQAATEAAPADQPIVPLVEEVGGEDLNQQAPE